MNIKNNIRRVNGYQKGADGAISSDGAEGKGRFRAEKPILMRHSQGLKIEGPGTYPTFGTHGNHIVH